MELTQEKLQHCLSYDETTGNFKWVNSNSTRKQFRDRAGFLRKDGYVCVRIENIQYMAHRLAWLYAYGVFPDEQIDHINGNRSDNRLINLRVATQKENGENRKLHRNNTSGHRGVIWKKSHKKWEVVIRHNYKLKCFGRFDDLEEAVRVAKKARDELFTHHQTSHSS